MPELILPGWVKSTNEEERLDLICRQHDGDLVFRRNESNDQYTIFQRLMRDNPYAAKADATDDVVKTADDNYIPVKAWGHRLPAVDEVKEWLWTADSWRHDHVAKCRRHNAEVKKQKDKAMAEVSHEAAERAEFAFRRAGEYTGVIKSMRKDGKRRRAF